MFNVKLLLSLLLLSFDENHIFSPSFFSSFSSSMLSRMVYKKSYIQRIVSFSHFDKLFLFIFMAHPQEKQALNRASFNFFYGWVFKSIFDLLKSYF